jgi:hypothetical protein
MSAQEQPVVIVARSKRDNADLQNMIGNFATEFAYKTNLAGNPSFTEITERVMQTMIDAESYQPVPLDWVRRRLAKEGINFTAPIIDYMPGDIEPPKVEGLRQLRFHPPPRSNNFPGPYGIRLRDNSNGIEGSMMYRNDLYDKSTIHTFLGHFYKIVNTIITAPETRLHDF